MHRYFDPAIPLTGIYLIKWNPLVLKHICTRVFAVDSFETEKQSKKKKKKWNPWGKKEYQEIRNGLNNLRSIHTIEY